MFLGIVLGIVSGFAIMGGSGLLVGGAFRAASGGRKATEKRGQNYDHINCWDMVCLMA